MSFPPGRSAGLSAMTGMPSGEKPSMPKVKPTHRGKRSRGKGPKVGPNTPEAHIESIQQALSDGNHQAAKTSALHLANALHRMTGSKAPIASNADTDDSQPLSQL